MDNQKKIQSLAILGCPSPQKRTSCSGCSLSSCPAIEMATEAVQRGWGVEKEAIATFMGQVLAMPEPDKAKAMKIRFKKLYS